MAPCFDKNGRKKGAWSEEEDNRLRAYIERNGHYNWRELPKLAGMIQLLNFHLPEDDLLNYTLA